MRRQPEMYKGMLLKQVNKTTARKLYNQGATVYLLPCNVRLNNMWVAPIGIHSDEIDADFDNRVAFYEVYNCVDELGSYTHFLVESKEG